MLDWLFIDEVYEYFINSKSLFPLLTLIFLTRINFFIYSRIKSPKSRAKGSKSKWSKGYYPKNTRVKKQLALSNNSGIFFKLQRNPEFTANSFINFTAKTKEIVVPSLQNIKTDPKIFFRPKNLKSLNNLKKFQFVKYKRPTSPDPIRRRMCQSPLTGKDIKQ